MLLRPIFWGSPTSTMDFFLNKKKNLASSGFCVFFYFYWGIHSGSQARRASRENHCIHKSSLPPHVETLRQIFTTKDGISKLLSRIYISWQGTAYSIMDRSWKAQSWSNITSSTFRGNCLTLTKFWKAVLISDWLSEHSFVNVKFDESVKTC